ncbi:MAG: PBP1A family penicillin-binding protein [Armatimonadetes bacterium]|nr:PBP1A family penicillin-binding protein [Armatimonadota bacterium]
MTTPQSTRSMARRNRRSHLRSFVTALQILILLGVSVSVGVALAMFLDLSGKLPTIGNFEAPEASIIYSSDNVILARIYREDRTNVPLKDIPENLRIATVAIEDSRFYQHSGVDAKGIMRAIWANVRGQRMAQGGSTITQQLARNVYLTQRKSIQRKLQEAVLAILMERNFTKKKILELYLNQVYYGSGAFGVQAASRVYYGKDVNQLDLSECALIAGMPQKPSGYSPHEDKEAAMDRRDVVLNRMAELGYITPQQRDAAKAEKLNIIPRRKGRNTYKAPHFVDYVTKQLRESYQDDRLFRGGLRVYTTLNYEMQQIAEDALRSGVKKHEKLRRVSEGCFVAIEPVTGYVRAMVGSVDPASQFNRCTQAMRQPGSSFKAFVYTAALMAGMKPTDRISNSSYQRPDGSGGMWRPKNYDGSFGGSVTMKVAVAKSINLPAIRTAEKVGINNVIKYAQLMGIRSPIDPYLSSAIGGFGGLHPIEMASAYGTFANGGVYVEPCSILKVTNSHGETYQDYVPEGKRVIPEQINAMMDDMFRGVVTGRGGTGYNARSIKDARGKTGTTNNDVDAWFIGYVPGKLVAACWVGNDNYSPMRRAFGGLVCAPIWVQFMQKALPIYERIHKDDQIAVAKKDAKKEQVKDKPADTTKKERIELPKTDADADVVAKDNSDVVSVSICDQSRLLATRNCPNTRAEKFLRGTEPTTYCTLHSPSNSDSARERPRAVDPDVTLVTVKVCSESGMLAGPNCPNVARRRVPIDDVPTQVCTVHSRGRE